MLSTIVRFVSSVLGGLIAFYLATRALDAAGYMGRGTMARVDALYRRLLGPVLDADAGAATTLAVVAGLLAVQAVVVVALLHRWSYRRADGAPLVTHR
jgi:hypothetical protein